MARLLPARRRVDGRAVLLTLERISQGGIYDHLGGGFARYSTDAEWLYRISKRCFYDNAGLVELLTLAWKQIGDPLSQRARGPAGCCAR